ncbi:MAG: hypothetical protein HY542_01250 [Deltaproteobacteria bacterium]|nr:hypothetical protein [Deltaproteobacteria bacterium]
MGNWSVYVAPEEERLLKKRIEDLAAKNRWSFSQAVSAILREHLIDEKKRIPDDEGWSRVSTEAFFGGYSEKDGIYDDL